MDKDTLLSAEQAEMVRDAYARWAIAGITHVGLQGERLFEVWQSGEALAMEVARQLGVQVLDPIDDRVAIAIAIVHTRERAPGTYKRIMRSVDSKTMHLGEA